MKATALLLVALVFLGACAAQLAHPGRFQPSGLSSTRVHRLPFIDNEILLALENEQKHGGYQFGHVVEFPLSMDDAGFWSFHANGQKVWTMTIESKGALSLGVTFSKFFIPEGAELYLVGEKKTRGAFTSLNNPANGVLTTFPLEGSTLTLEYIQPADVEGSPVFEIIKVTHGYKPFNFGDSGNCNINVACDTGKWANQIRSSGMLLSGFGSRFCSGALVNNVDNDGDQLFLTANHCSVDSADQIMFNYQSPNCSPNTDGPTDDIVGGITNLARNTYSDFAILRIGETIPNSWNVYLSGISAVNVAPTSMTGIHHPSGDVKKISHANKAGIADRWSAAEPGLWHWRVSSWDEGTTEPGSSGSPLYDQNQRVVGQLHGGAASCLNKAYDSYGAVWASWSNGLANYIDPSGTGNQLINGTDLNAARGF